MESATANEGTCNAPAGADRSGLPAESAARGRPEGSPAAGGRSRNVWRRLRVVLSLGLLGAAIGLVATEGASFARAGALLGRVDGRWVAVAVGAETGSMLALGCLQQRLLAAGGARLRLRTMVAITPAGNAFTGTLPGGVAWAAAWLYEQLGQRGVPRFLRVWMFLVAGAVSSFALFLLIATGVETAGPTGPTASLRLLAVLLALIPVATAGVAAAARLAPVRRRAARLAAMVESRAPGARRLLAVQRGLAGRLDAVHLGRRGWAMALALALANWLLDCLVVVASMEALGVTVPWSAILVVYGLTQISASLPLTPGGIGVVAGSLAALLHAYGVPVTSALAVVLLYRIVSFWGLVPIGWATWSVVDFGSRRGRRAARRPVLAGRGAAAHPAPSASASVGPPTRSASGGSPPDEGSTLAEGSTHPDRREPVAAGAGGGWRDGR